ncbi:MAG: C45 family autoproteolytic acyltransferase/hydrolase [Candidatus Hydrogenedentota bacterium]
MEPAVHPAGQAEVVRRAGRGFLETYRSPLGTLPVVHVAGEPEDIGRQYGALLGGTVHSIVRLLLDLFKDGGMPEHLIHRLLDACWERMAPHVPARFLTEMQGIAAGARSAGHHLSEQDVRRVMTMTNLDLYMREARIPELLGMAPGSFTGGPDQPPLQCTMFALWGSRTVDGKLFALRNLDWISQSGMHHQRLVSVYHPEGRHAFVSMGYAGVIGALAGMNDAGISLSQVGTFSVSEELDGEPWAFMARRVLEEAGTLEEAVPIAEKARHTIGYNFLIADGDPENFGAEAFNPRAAALETNHECCETFYENDPKEHHAAWADDEGETHAYGTPLKEAIIRADTAFGPSTRALQAADNGPGVPGQNGNPYGEDGNGTTYTECHLPMYEMIRAYETGAEYVFPVRNTKVIEAGAPRKIGVGEALNIAATVAHNTEKLPENDWNVMSVVYAPTDGLFWVGYEHEDEAGNWKNAPDAGYWRFDLAELFARKPG